MPIIGIIVPDGTGIYQPRPRSAGATFKTPRPAATGCKPYPAQSNVTDGVANPVQQHNLP
jgi:hypothetical protein